MVFFVIILLLFQAKHWYIDFVNQSEEEVKHKGIYFDWRGVKHSVKHGIGTYIILIPFINIEWTLYLAAIDFLIHYHIDWIKMKFGERDISKPAFWAQLGFDQFAHQVTYIFLTFTTGIIWLNT